MIAPISITNKEAQLYYLISGEIEDPTKVCRVFYDELYILVRPLNTWYLLSAIKEPHTKGVASASTTKIWMNTGELHE